MKIENDESMICECGEKYHVSVFPAWIKAKTQINILEKLFLAIRALLKVLEE